MQGFKHDDDALDNDVATDDDSHDGKKGKAGDKEENAHGQKGETVGQAAEPFKEPLFKRKCNLMSSFSAVPSVLQDFLAVLREFLRRPDVAPLLSTAMARHSDDAFLFSYNIRIFHDTPSLASPAHEGRGQHIRVIMNPVFLENEGREPTKEAVIENHRERRIKRGNPVP